MQETTVVLGRDDMRRTLVRITHEIVEKNPTGLAIVGIHRRGAVLARRIHTLLRDMVATDVPFGTVDISFYRDDLGLRAAGPGAGLGLGAVGSDAVPIVRSTELNFAVDGRTIVIVDDVLFTGRTVRAAIDVLFDYGRPARVQLAVLADRGHRELPIRPDYVGKNLPTALDQRVNVHVEEIDGADEVTITPVRSQSAAQTQLDPHTQPRRVA